MKIAVISDIHENFYNLVSFYEKIANMNIDYIFCLGDIMSNSMAKILAYSGIPVHMVWGNNDGNRVAITKTSLSKRSKLSVSSETFDVLELGGKKFFLTHYPILAKSMVKSGDFDAVFFGHSHITINKKVGDALLLNPGELASHATGKATFAIYDSEMNAAEIIELDDYKNTKFNKVGEYQEKIDANTEYIN